MHSQDFPNKGMFLFGLRDCLCNFPQSYAELPDDPCSVMSSYSRMTSALCAHGKCTAACLVGFSGHSTLWSQGFSQSLAVMQSSFMGIVV